MHAGGGLVGIREYFAHYSLVQGANLYLHDLTGTNFKPIGASSTSGGGGDDGSDDEDEDG